MPVYDYACRDCGHPFSFLHRSPDEAAECPQCGSLQVEQLPVLRTAIRGARRERRVIDMSSGLCPCGCGKARHATRA